MTADFDHDNLKPIKYANKYIAHRGTVTFFTPHNDAGESYGREKRAVFTCYRVLEGRGWSGAEPEVPVLPLPGTAPYARLSRSSHFLKTLSLICTGTGTLGSREKYGGKKIGPHR